MEEIGKTCRRREQTVNGNTVVEYTYKGNRFASVTSLLASIYPDQGSYYEVEYGVSRKDAQIAGWSPYTNYGRFEDGEAGFKKFLKDRGEIAGQDITTTITISDIIANMMDEYAPPPSVEDI